MWTPLYDSGFVTESSLSITDTDSETYDLIIVQFRRHEFKQFNLDFIKEGGKDFIRERKKKRKAITISFIQVVDPITLMIGTRKFAASKRKKDKVTETRRPTRSGNASYYRTVYLLS